MKFDSEKIDMSNNFDPNTGVFVASKSGQYSFFFNAHTDSTYGRIDVNLNGGDVQYLYHHDDASERRQITLFWTMDLVSNDEVYLNNIESNGIYCSDKHKMHFMGYRLN